MATSSTEAATDTTRNNVVEISNEDASSETSEEIASVLNKIHSDINTIIRKMDIINFVIYILGVNTAINLIIMILLCINTITVIVGFRPGIQ